MATFHKPSRPRVIVAFNRKEKVLVVHSPKGWTREAERAILYPDKDAAHRVIEEGRAKAPAGMKMDVIPHSVLMEMRHNWAVEAAQKK